MQYETCRGVQGINQGLIHPFLPFLMKILSLILFSSFFFKPYSNEKQPWMVIRVLQVTTIAELPELHQHCSWGSSIIYFVALRAARVLLFPHHHNFAPPGSSLGSCYFLWGCGGTLAIFENYLCLLGNVLSNRRRLCAWEEGSILQPSQLTWAQGLRELHLFCLSVWCFCDRAFLVLQVLREFDIVPGERNEASESRFCKNCIQDTQ